MEVTITHQLCCNRAFVLHDSVSGELLTVNQQTSRPESEMRLHLSVYQLGAYADDIAMMEAAENHFGLVIKDHWTDPYFLTAIHQAYQNAPPGPPGATLRGIVLTMVANHIVTLCRNPQFIALLEGIPLFGGEVAQVLAGVHDVQPAEKIAFKCGDDKCNTLHVVNLDGQVLTRCHYLQHDDGMERLGLLRLFECPFIGCVWSFFSTKAIDKPNDSDEENDDLDEGPILCPACGHSSDNRDWSLNTDFRARRGYTEGW